MDDDATSLISIVSNLYRLDHTLGARQHVDTGRAAREHMLGHRHEAAGILQEHMLADPNDRILDLDHIVRVLALFAAMPAPRCGRAALADDRALAQIGPHIQRVADIRDMDVAA